MLDLTPTVSVTPTVSAATMLLAASPAGWVMAAGLVIGGVLYGSEAADWVGKTSEWVVFDMFEGSNR